jgi:hypothetical protein
MRQALFAPAQAWRKKRQTICIENSGAMARNEFVDCGERQ